MNITSSSLTKAAGAAAAVAGSIFIAVQINHPATDAFTTETTQWVARSCAKTVMAALALAGITGMYLRQYRKGGLLGLVGYLVFAAGYLGMFSVEVIGAAVLPNLVHTEPGFVNDVVAAANGGTAKGDIGGLQRRSRSLALRFGEQGEGLHQPAPPFPTPANPTPSRPATGQGAWSRFTGTGWTWSTGSSQLRHARTSAHSPGTNHRPPHGELGRIPPVEYETKQGSSDLSMVGRECLELRVRAFG
jgi:hypothetical protein